MGLPSPELLQNLAYVERVGKIRVNYLNQNAVDSFGKITVNNLKLNDTVDIDTDNVLR
jgi:hypothetical protein